MRFLLMIKSTENQSAGGPPFALIEAIGKLGEEATKDGTLLDQGGLLPTAMGAEVHLSDGKVTVVDGPFSEAKEVIGGYAMYQLRSKEEAIEAGRKFMQLHADYWPGFTASCEIRQLFEAGDFDPDALRG